MPAQPWCTGPAYGFLRFASGSFTGQTKFLGTCKDTPRLDFNPEYEPIFNDIGGQRIPFDRLYQGEEGICTFQPLTRWDESVLAAAVALPFSGGVGNQPRGANLPGDIGTLMGFEGAAPELFLLYPYALKPAMNGLPPGYHFYCAVLDSHGRSRQGTAALESPMTYILQRKYLPSAASGLVAGTFLTYDNALQLQALLSLVT